MINMLLLNWLLTQVCLHIKMQFHSTTTTLHLTTELTPKLGATTDLRLGKQPVRVLNFASVPLY